MDETPEDSPPKKKSLVMPAIALAAVLGAGSFGASLLMLGTPPAPATEDHAAQSGEEAGATDAGTETEFLPMEPLLISLGPRTGNKQLRFEGYLEIPVASRETVQGGMPRVMDVLNTYLRSVEPQELSEPTALLKFRLQMLRRVQLVLGEEVVYDLLISKFLIG
ncbi:flagellar basal body-associated FliL family protein [Mangrovicoccus algicola]|uniref:Flagellar protein FliL n=1 Tax=Mangrovicoccus algicola TaxID=2771008 RepID=A0A8J7CKM9_9RHOB|nr:flagellar basal body-associated FliL family protein [Mangrovicoccus algicola]MBE3639031.1 flagellar basal body-associated FliL family protein [Mangrovicoccus algicola]